MSDPQTKQDLKISDLHSLPTIELDVRLINPGRFTLLEALDIADAASIDHTEFVSVLQRGTMRQKALLMYAVAWIAARRENRGLTFEEVCTYNLKVIGTAPDDAELERDAQRADAIVAVAKLAGVSPAEAEQMPLSQVAAVTKLATRRRKRRGRR